MGLEAINFYLKTKLPIMPIIGKTINLIKNSPSYYVFYKEEEFWIDIEKLNENCISIRITLCNKENEVLKALDTFIENTFKESESMLQILNSGETFKVYNDFVKGRVRDVYSERRKIFESIYGNYSAAIGSDEFYKIMRRENE